jgi:hypothetical protein
MSGPITVNISGTFSEKQRMNNGMEKVGPYLNSHRLARVPVVAYVEWHSHGETRTGEKMAVVLPAIEPGITAGGGDVPGLPVQDGYPTDAAGQIMWLLDSIRRAGGKGAVADTLFSVPSGDIHGDDDEDDEELEGQQELIRVGPDGPHTVPPASGEELPAELEERRAATGPTRAEQETSEPADFPDADSPKVPAATFSGGDPE